MPFTKINSDTYSSPSGKKFTSKQVKAYYATNGFTKGVIKKKAKLSVNNKMKGTLGRMNTQTNKVEINIKKHKGDKAELASTIKHELMHVKHPNMTEKEVYKKTAKTKIAPKEQTKLLSKLKGAKTTNYKVGALKRKFKLGKSKQEVGTFISKANDLKGKKLLAVKGLV